MSWPSQRRAPASRAPYAATGAGTGYRVGRVTPARGYQAGHLIRIGPEHLVGLDRRQRRELVVRGQCDQRDRQHREASHG